ncbi:peptidoglycan-binding protein [Lentibacillus sp. CBA3610]|nr:peptidoglycan-binding protein [Lentibacillus sp. CBA3610]
MTLKEDLTSLGFANWSDPTQYYGSITAGVVEDFQDYYNLPVTGIADEGTRNKISEVLNPPYRNGDRGDPVVELKENLTELGFANWSNPSQYYGSVTAGVVEDFQSAHDLTVDGITDQNTLSKIEEALTNDPYYEEGDSGDHVVALKEDLTSLGFANWSDPTPILW